jgi:hypothetical protein
MRIIFFKYIIILVLTDGIVGFVKGGADPPKADLECDRGGGLVVGEGDGLPRVEPYIAHEASDEGGQRDHPHNHPQTGGPHPLPPAHLSLKKKKTN